MSNSRAWTASGSAMRLALATSALPADGHADWLARLPDYGISGLDIDPAASWPDSPGTPTAGTVNQSLRQWRRAGLSVVGIRFDLDAHAGLGWFGDAAARERTLAHLVHLSAIARDCGATTLVIAGRRWRGELADLLAWRATRTFLESLLPRIENHGSVLCLAPLVPDEGNFCNRAMDCRILADAIDHPAFGLCMSTRALLANGEINRHAVFASHYGRLELFTADEPELAAFASSGQVDHAAMRRHLSAGGYRNWVCLRQRADAGQLDAALRAFVDCYQRPDNLSLLQHRQQQAAAQLSAAARNPNPDRARP